MSEASSSTDVVELTLNFQGLRVTVAGPARRAAELVSDIARHHLPRDPSPSSDHYSFVDLAPEALQSRPPAVESPARSSVPRVETRDSVERSFAACPDHLLREAGRLGGLPELQRFRVDRAWRAGQWAGATLRGRVHSPNRTPPLDVRPRIYVVLRGGSGERPAAFSSSHSYWRALGGSHSDSSISHSFPSETEARIYCLGADTVFPKVQP